MIGTSINQYRITAGIGAGGMGEVFRARDTRLNRDVAVKVLPKDFVSDADRRRRFEQEAQTLAALNHPNILTVHDAGVHEGMPYLVSELLEGQTLRDLLGSTAKPQVIIGTRSCWLTLEGGMKQSLKLRRRTRLLLSFRVVSANGSLWLAGATRHWSRQKRPSNFLRTSHRLT